ncbi:hypothetical protein CLOSTMETH_01860 [[Clostridium] methylpentosum DSM 5476]|uniref:Uncharacterized protein n=1 Tax=[Clostridium] methylpentosum DSM 5476 TaxID=537013 RepID=C0EDD3_9FIRM|nr:hypothetical protein CLOSTMETH_01860 [[Clostridium] methylpentosum DSM 5476]
MISIHAPLVGSDAVKFYPAVLWRISIHAPLVGSDSFLSAAQSDRLQFQSTLPLWGATNTRYNDYKSKDISIHAPLVGSDPLRDSA